jgi:hypothetical protein
MPTRGPEGASTTITPSVESPVINRCPRCENYYAVSLSVRGLSNGWGFIKDIVLTLLINRFLYGRIELTLG